MVTSWRQMGEPIIFLRTFALASKIGGTSEMKRKTSFSFTFHSVCTIFAPQSKIGGTVVQERITHRTEHSVRTQTWATPQ